MQYSFEILGVSPILYFFNQQQELLHQQRRNSVEYIGIYQCTLDALLESVAAIRLQPNWDAEKIMQTAIDFWVNNSDTIRYWKARLQDAGRENLLVSRVADMQGLQIEFELLLQK